MGENIWAFLEHLENGFFADVCSLYAKNYIFLGSSKHPVTKQPVPEERFAGACILSSLIPLQLVCHIPGRKIPLVLWENIYSNSVLSLRPLKTW